MPDIRLFEVSGIKPSNQVSDLIPDLKKGRIIRSTKFPVHPYATVYWYCILIVGDFSWGFLKLIFQLSRFFHIKKIIVLALNQIYFQTSKL
jgi:hypothetical protein